jgi:hypothetical protein
MGVSRDFGTFSTTSDVTLSGRRPGNDPGLNAMEEAMTHPPTHAARQLQVVFLEAESDTGFDERIDNRPSKDGELTMQPKPPQEAAPPAWALPLIALPPRPCR